MAARRSHAPRIAATGDGDTQPIPSQDLGEPLGKILRIDPRESGGMPYSVPLGNPYLNDGTLERCPRSGRADCATPSAWGSTRSRETLWVGDVGGSRFEELNLLRGADGRNPGANFGWRITEGDLLVGSDTPVTPANAPPDYVAPVVVRRHDEDPARALRSMTQRSQRSTASSSTPTSSTA
jgi:hypothetical protein